MIPTPSHPARVAPGLFLCAALLLAAGCASDDDRPPSREAGKHREHFPTMAGQETFFKGGLTAEILVGAMTGFDRGGDGTAMGGEHGGRRHGGGGMHMSGMGGGGGRRHGGGDGEARPGDDDPNRAQSQATRRASNMGSPPVMIHLRFVNNGAEKLDVVIADFLSPLGNFVVQPEKFSLDPGQALTAEPMTSRLAGEPGGGEITLSLKAGGVTETKTITLALQPEPAAPSPEKQP